ncbi:MAG: DUF1456 family protein [Granulosicoccus sp.]|nr:DUF1456 family protein [Granulosicoccus sp.]
MDNNEFTRRIRYALRLDDEETARLMRQVDFPVTLAQVSGYRCKEGEPEFQHCPDDALLALLDGLILDKRGPAPVPSTTGNAPISNNLILKQLRIALSLRSDDIHELITEGGGKIGKSEAGAFFRSPQARNYRRCGDQVVRWFLTGLGNRRGQ